MSDSDPTQHDPTWQKTTDEARRQRIEALRDMAADRSQAPASAAVQAPRPSLAPPSTRNRSSHPRTLWLAADALVLAIVLVGVFVLTRPGGASTVHKAPPTGPLVLHTEEDSLACATGAAWSGDGTQLAVLGATTCDELSGRGMLNIYNVSDGKLVAKVQLSDVTKRALSAVNTSGTGDLLIAYTHVLWVGPAVFVTIQVTPDNFAKLPYVGLLRITPSDQQLTAYVQPNHGGSFGVYMRWNPTAGSVQFTRDAVVNSIGIVSASLPPSLAYDWQADGSLDLLHPVQAGKQPLRDPGGPVGVPSSGSRLTIWQPALVTYAGTEGKTAAFIFTTDFAAATGGTPSIVDSVRVRGLLVSLGSLSPDKKALDAFNLSSAPWLPVRDAALQAVMDAMAGGDSQIGTNATSVAWRPDGAVLAAQPNSPGVETDDQGNVTISDITLYDTTTGHTLATLNVPPQQATGVHAMGTMMQRAPNSGNESPSTIMQWSPNGHALMLMEIDSGTLVVWSQAQLPH